MKYILVTWPEIQDYMDRPDYNENVYFDSRKNIWFIPEEWEDYSEEKYQGEIGDLEDAYG